VGYICRLCNALCFAVTFMGHQVIYGRKVFLKATKRNISSFHISYKNLKVVCFLW